MSELSKQEIPEDEELLEPRFDIRNRDELWELVEMVPNGLRWINRGRIADLTSQLSSAREEIVKLKDLPAKILPRLVVCAVIIRDGKVLLEKRAPAGVDGLDGMWDLPGGKVEPNESPAEAIIREIAEELSIGIRPVGLLPYLPTSTWAYPDGERRHWILAAYRCDIISGEPVLTERLQWFNLKDLAGAHILEADRRLIALASCAAPPSPEGQQK